MASFRFREIVARVKALKDCWRDGLGALLKRDKKLVSASNARKLQGSVNLDECLRATAPNDKRWDYAIGYEADDGEKVYYVEVHPASTSDIPTVLAKHKWLREWLQTQAHTLEKLPSEYWWVATGRIKLLPTSHQAKQLTAAKIQGPTKSLVLDKSDAKKRPKRR